MVYSSLIRTPPRQVLLGLDNCAKNPTWLTWPDRGTHTLKGANGIPASCYYTNIHTVFFDSVFRDFICICNHLRTLVRQVVSPVGVWVERDVSGCVAVHQGHRTACNIVRVRTPRAVVRWLAPYFGVTLRGAYIALNGHSCNIEIILPISK